MHRILGKTQGTEDIPKEAADDVLEQPHGLLLHQLSDHVAQHGPHGVESLVGGADVGKTNIIQQYLLYNEDGHRLAQLRARLHNAKAERDDLGSEKEVDDIRGVILDQCTDHAQGGEAQVFERARFRSGVEEWVEEKRDVS